MGYANLNNHIGEKNLSKQCTRMLCFGSVITKKEKQWCEPHLCGMVTTIFLEEIHFSLLWKFGFLLQSLQYSQS